MGFTGSLLLSEILLDMKNPRFLYDRTGDTQNNIFKYLWDTEDVKQIAESIVRQGFVTIGEHVIVTKENDSFVVVEGNRRIAALKYLHGLFEYKKPDFIVDPNLISSTSNIVVDFVDDRNEAAKPMANRHIVSIKLWGPEQRRRFYAIQYLSGKTLNEVQDMSPETEYKVTEFIRQYIFLQYAKDIYGKNDISTPSLIYERVYQFLIAFELINPLIIQDLYIHTQLEIKSSVLQPDEVKELLKLLILEIVEKKTINSRSANTIDVFINFHKGNSHLLDPRLSELLGIAIARYKSKNSVFSLKKISFIENDPSVRNEDVLHAGTRITEVKITDENNTPCLIANFTELPSGEYKIEHITGSATLKVNSRLTPKIIINSHAFEMISIDQPVKVNDLFSCCDIFGRNISLPSPFLHIDFSTGNYSNHDGIFSVSSSTLVAFKVTYTHPSHPHLTTSISHEFIPKPIIKSVISASDSKRFFKSVFFEPQFTSDKPISSIIFTELETAYISGMTAIFSAALRSSIECLIYEFITDCNLINPRSVTFSGLSPYDMNGCIEKFAELSMIVSGVKDKRLTDMIKKYDSTCSVPTKHRRDEMYNYFNLNLTESDVHSVVSGLHLGAHKSITNITTINLQKMCPHINAIIQMANLIRVTGFTI